MSRYYRLAAGMLLATALLLPPTVHALEARMLTHMLLQMPLLLAAGMIAAGQPHSEPTHRGWNQAGISGLLVFAVISTFWMLPIAIDQAVASPIWDAAKGSSLVLAGAAVRTSWTTAPTIVQVFFAGNFAWMTIVAGQLYEDQGVRLCNAYLLGDQSTTGVALSWAPVIAVAAWAANRTWAKRRRARPVAAQPPPLRGTTHFAGNDDTSKLQSESADVMPISLCELQDDRDPGERWRER